MSAPSPRRSASLPLMKDSMVKYVRTLLLPLFLVSALSWAQSVSDVPIDIDVPVRPMPVKANGKVHLLYELHLTNFRTQSLEVTRLEVSDGSVSKFAEYA